MSTTTSKKNANAASGKRNSNVYFDAPAAGAHLRALRSKAVEAGQNPRTTRWYAGALHFRMSQGHKSKNNNNGLVWFPVELTLDDVTAPLMVRFYDERHVGRINPDSDAEVARLTALNKNPKIKIVKRDKSPSIQVYQFNWIPPMEADGVTLKTDVKPPEDKRSKYFEVASLVDEAFQTEMRLLKAEEGHQHRGLQGHDRRGDADPGGHPRRDQHARRRPHPDAHLARTPIRRRRASRWPTRWPASTSTSRLSAPVFLDGEKQFKKPGGGKGIEPLRIDGQPVGASNIHLAIESGSQIDGIVDMSSVCFSGFGISMPHKCCVLSVKKADRTWAAGFDAEDLLSGLAASEDTASGDADASEPEARPAAAAASAPASAAATRAAAASAAASAAAAPATGPISEDSPCSWATPGPAAPDENWFR